MRDRVAHVCIHWYLCQVNNTYELNDQCGMSKRGKYASERATETEQNYEKNSTAKQIFVEEIKTKHKKNTQARIV